MTSSLVGSEMCIRDRATRGGAGNDDGDELQVISRNSSEEQTRNVKSPVSYTHLTLPTICSV
eukprot:3915151-Prorocentrum_lima.AAC.1